MIRNGKTNESRAFAQAELLLVAGDMTPAASRHEEFLQAFPDAGTRPIFLPVVGNHDGGASLQHIRDVLIPAIPNVVRRQAASCDYYVDRKNIRIIGVAGAVIDEESRKWVGQVVKTAPASVDHIFVMSHHPAFPRGRRVGQSLDRNPAQRDAFWQMLVDNRDRVRAVFSGHTHSYSRMRVLDPAGAAANDPKTSPDEEGGIYQIIAGSTGMGRRNTLVQVQIEGTNVLVRAWEADNGPDMPFAARDEWRIGPGATGGTSNDVGRSREQSKPGETR
jgi:3',5'-cyclic AMP phosphodiesterase CpdA